MIQIEPQTPLSRWVQSWADSERLYLWLERTGMFLDDGIPLHEAERRAFKIVFPHVHLPERFRTALTN